MVSFWSIMLLGEKKTCKVGMLSFSQCCGRKEKKKGGVGGEGRCKGEGGGCTYAFLNGIDGKRKKRSNQIPTKKLLGGPLIR
jgi:hypothetical protein